MLRGIRKASSNWLGRIVMGVVLGLIAISFAIWGIGDIFRGFGRSTVAKIGSTEITVDQFRQIYNDRLQQLGRQLGRPITQDQARLLRLDQQLAGPARRGSRPRPARAADAAQPLGRRGRAPDHGRPELQGRRPASSTARASRQIIRNAGYTEPRFAAEQKKLTLAARDRRNRQRRPQPAEDAGAGAITATRTSSARSTTSTLDRAKAGDIAPPTPEEIAELFRRARRRSSARPNIAASSSCR